MVRSLKFARRNYFIDKPFQTAFIVKFSFLIIATSILIGIMIYYMNRHTTTVAFENLKVVVRSTADFILPAMFQVLAAVTVLVILATAAVTLFASHKIAGPLYRFKLEMDKIKRGDFSHAIHVRDSDQLKNLATDFEEMRVSVRDTVKTLKKSWGAVKAHLRMVEDEMKSSKIKKGIEEDISKIDAELAKFKTEIEENDDGKNI
ncbi:MAG: methyl-accepting chemotaxis protein [Candidatus Omnitrophota bacterium]